MPSPIDLKDAFTREALLIEIEQGLVPDYLFFWGHRARRGQPVGPHVLSQWFESPFEVEGRRYRTAEHWMMAEKARLFGDAQTCELILKAGEPGKAKALGREVRGFDERTWQEHRVTIVRAGNRAKFEQNPPLFRYLLSTGSKVLAEASPLDSIWGIGLGAENPEARNLRAWPGMNLLGFALMWARAELSGRTGRT